MRIRPERESDVAEIFALTRAAFARAAHSSGTEQYIVNALRQAGALTLSLVAEDAQEIIGHIAVSPVRISDGSSGWYGLGPVSVAPARQREGTGSGLVMAALDSLKGMGANGCVLLGDPAYYARFGFHPHASMILPGVPAEYFQGLSFSGRIPEGEVSYHPAFEVNQ